LNAEGCIFSEEKAGLELNELQQCIFRRIIEGGWSAGELGQSFLRNSEGNSIRAEQSVLKFLSKLPFIDIACLDPPVRADAIIVDRGWGGISQHSVDLWQALNSKANLVVLLVSPWEPTNGYEEALGNRLFTPRRCGLKDFSFIGFVNIARSLLKMVTCELILLSHYAVSPYFSDIVMDHAAITYGDDHSDYALMLGRHLVRNATEEKISDVLQEIFLGPEEVWLNVAAAKSYYRTFLGAKENWFWTNAQRDRLKSHFPELAHKFRVVPPLIDTDQFAPDPSESAGQWILFTTMSEAEKAGAKGLNPLRSVLPRLPSNARLRLILRESTSIDSGLQQFGDRLQVLTRIPKRKMAGYYREAVVNCRVSRDDNAPISVLESMACGVPVIVSPTIASNIPIIRDGMNGFVIEPDDEESLEDRLRLLLNDVNLRMEMGKAARSTVAQYSLSTNLSQVVSRLNGYTESDERR
jgi:glycosyltransferase involved in cell wall biosynthesis